MIQRKQSIWLLIATLLNSGVLFFPLFNVHTMLAGVETVVPYNTNQHFPLLIIAIVMIVMPLIAIFMYSNRKRQTRVVLFSLIVCCSFLTQMLVNANVTAPDTVTYWIGAVLPVVSVIFIIMAVVGIRRDEKLVRSADRLR